MTFVNVVDINSKAQIIKKLINDNNILGMSYSVDFKMEHNNTEYFYIFYIDDDTYCSAGYMRNTRGYPSCYILFVNSYIGNRTGSFLFLLQVLLAISLNCTEITLDNYTDDPARAATGIYSLFEVNRLGSPRLAFIGNKSIEERLMAAENKMIHYTNPDSLNGVYKSLRIIAVRIDETEAPWHLDSKKNIESFISQLKANNLSLLTPTGLRTPRVFSTEREKRIKKRARESNI